MCFRRVEPYFVCVEPYLLCVELNHILLCVEPYFVCVELNHICYPRVELSNSILMCWTIYCTSIVLYNSYPNTGFPHQTEMPIFSWFYLRSFVILKEDRFALYLTLGTLWLLCFSGPLSPCAAWEVGKVVSLIFHVLNFHDLYLFDYCVFWIAQSIMVVPMTVCFTDFRFMF